MLPGAALLENLRDLGGRPPVPRQAKDALQLTITSCSPPRRGSCGLPGRIGTTRHFLERRDDFSRIPAIPPISTGTTAVLGGGAARRGRWSVSAANGTPADRRPRLPRRRDRARVRARNGLGRPLRRAARCRGAGRGRCRRGGRPAPGRARHRAGGGGRRARPRRGRARRVRGRAGELPGRSGGRGARRSRGRERRAGPDRGTRRRRRLRAHQLHARHHLADHAGAADLRRSGPRWWSGRRSSTPSATAGPTSWTRPRSSSSRPRTRRPSRRPR